MCGIYIAMDVRWMLKLRVSRQENVFKASKMRSVAI